MKKNFKWIQLAKGIIIVASMVFTISSCQKETFIDLEIDPIPTDSKMMVLGDQIPNAYTVDNMTQAYLNLSQSNKKNLVDFDIPLETTHYYVRFLPKSYQELAILQKDTTLLLFDFPIDYEVLGNGTYYHDPSLPEDAITWQYCTVEANYKFPELEYEIIEELFLPDSKIDNSNLKSLESNSFWRELENEARRIVGIDDSSEKKSISGSDYYPSGTIKAYDNSGKGWSGLKGVKVIATRGFTSKSTITNSNGYFYINHGFGGAVNYKIKWERDDYDIRSGTYGQAYYNGPKQESAWDLNISSGSIDWCYAMIHRAAYHYYYNHWDYGIQAPPRQGGILNQRLHIGAMDKSGTSHYYDFNSFVFAAQVKIYCQYSSGSYRSSKSLYAVTIHELAHASHWELGYSTAQYLVDLIFSNAKIPESWAECVEHVIVSDIYGGSWNNNQSISLSNNTRYTAFFIDLIDSYNQSDYYSNGPVDNVEGYTISELEYALDKTYIDLSPYGPSALEPIWETFAPTILRNKLENLYDNETEEYLEELFDNYF